MNELTPPTSNVPIRTLVVAKYQLVQDSFKLLLESCKDIKVTSTHFFTDNIAFSSGIDECDVAVLYLIPGDRLEIITDLLKRAAEIRVIVLAAGADLDSQANAVKLGAVGIVQKEQSPKLLIEAIRQTYNGESWINQALLNKVLDRGKSGPKRSSRFPLESDIDALTARELDVVKMIGEGLKNKLIAEKLFISEATVRHHLSSIYGKVGVDDRLNLVIYAYQKGLINLSFLLLVCWLALS